jgi:hypothetical protein
MVKGKGKVVGGTIWYRILFSAVMGVILVGHFAWPGLKADQITLVLLILGAFPWLQPLFKSIEIPGIIKVEGHDLMKAAEQIGADKSKASQVPPDVNKLNESTILGLMEISKTNPSLALVGFRIEIEKRLIALTSKLGVRPNRPIGSGQLLRLVETQIDARARDGLKSLIMAANQAAHGVSI